MRHSFWPLLRILGWLIPRLHTMSQKDSKRLKKNSLFDIECRILVSCDIKNSSLWMPFDFVWLCLTAKYLQFCYRVIAYEIGIQMEKCSKCLCGIEDRRSAGRTESRALIIHQTPTVIGVKRRNSLLYEDS